MSGDSNHPHEQNVCAPSSHLRIIRWTEHFADLISVVLTLVLIVVIAVSAIQLVILLGDVILESVKNPTNVHGFEAVFGVIMTLLIAMEFNHSIVAALERKRHVIQVRAILLIALLALARKFIILDTKELSAETIAALALSMASIGGVYLFLRKVDAEAEKGQKFSLLNMGKK
uniref:Diguanylate cyclase n=1 Tax=Magnetococcus massalia (strain MO-1) TaxID=451514 RepID=A0A1S7LHC6_MAGMO|nr:conserved membrane protein of unknown function [Candidatus Magnetococcus massalia]